MTRSSSRNTKRKRPPPSAEVNTANKNESIGSQTSRPSPVFVICPGASSKEPTELREALTSSMLSTIMGYPSSADTRVVSKWKGIHPSRMRANVQLLLDLCHATGREFPNRPIYLVGHSFGTRVIIALLTKVHKQQERSDETEGPPPKARNSVDEVTDDTDNDDCDSVLLIPTMLDIHRAILESYPLYGPRPPTASTDRVKPLMECPVNLCCLFFSGQKDEFLDRRKDWRRDGDRKGTVSDYDGVKFGGEALQEVVAKMPNVQYCTIVIVENGKHNALKASKTDQADVIMRFQTSVAQFLSLNIDGRIQAVPTENTTSDKGGRMGTKRSRRK